MPTLGQYYNEMDSWYGGVPNYGSAYNNYLAQTGQPMSLARIVSMVNDIQQGMNRQPLGNQAMNLSIPTQAQTPAHIAQAIMNTQNRLLSLPRARYTASGFPSQEQPQVPQPNAPANNNLLPGRNVSGSRDSGGGGIMGGSNYGTLGNSLPTGGYSVPSGSNTGTGTGSGNSTPSTPLPTRLSSYQAALYGNSWGTRGF